MAIESETVERGFDKAMSKMRDACTDSWNDYPGWQVCLTEEQADVYLNEIEDAHKREVAAKDALIKELAYALNNIRENTDYDVEYGSHGGWIITDDDFSQSSIDTLVAKARGMVK